VLCPYTSIPPETADWPKFTLIVFVVLVPVAPSGRVHTYEVAFAIAGTV